MMLDGNTRLYAHIGYPTSSFKAPLIYNPYFAAHGINAAVVPMGVPAADFDAAFPAIMRFSNIAGALITMPHKVAVLRHLARVSPAIAVTGACNAVRREEDGTLSGDMFDGEGFARGVERKGQAIAGSRVLIVGAGGAGAAIAAALAARGPALIRLADLRTAIAGEIAARLAAHFPGLAAEAGTNDPAGFDIVVNATPLGMKPEDPLPLDPARLASGAFVGEVVLSRERTPLLEAAAARGCTIQIGLDMLFEMIPAYLEFFGFPPATADELRALAAIPAPEPA
jgi:shikimate dehydrogenase